MGFQKILADPLKPQRYFQAHLREYAKFFQNFGDRLHPFALLTLPNSD